ncbi:MAG TPA: T6SS immunity protein Tdi1 domain-containing protein [Puia sp.]|jgi:hypothetical protein|nr:T6SS immunity protein Tdi1 domain-containing protein [Puia sp.]
MFEIFINDNEQAKAEEPVFNTPPFESSPPSDFLALIAECGGHSYRNGLYKVHSLGSSIHWSILIANSFGQYKQKILPFGFDWLGRQYCLDIGNDDLIYMFDPATAEDFHLNESLEDFHNHDLVFEREDILAETQFLDTLKLLKLTSVPFHDCIGYKIPLFLGGADKITNYEIVNMEVYWEFQLQIYKQTKDLPAGTKIGEVKFNKK